MGLQKPSVMAGKATIRLVDRMIDDDVAASDSAVADMYDGDDEHFSLEMVAEHTTVSPFSDKLFQSRIFVVVFLNELCSTI